MINGQPEASDWLSVRQTKTANSRDNGGVSDINSSDMRCFGGTTAKNVATVAAGDTLGFVVSANVMHFGPISFYFARVPEGKEVKTWDGAGNVWFKVGELSAIQNGKALSGNEATWPAYRRSSVLQGMSGGPRKRKGLGHCSS